METIAETSSVNTTVESVETRTIKRIAWRLIPFLMVCYFIAYLDRVNLSFASLTMNKALGLTQDQYGFGAGLFFLSYCICEMPSNLIMYSVGANRWISRIMLSLGVCAAGMAFITNKEGFYTMRFLLGAAEAGFYPGILFFLTLWFPTKYRARYMGIFIAAIPISGIIGAPLSGFLLTLDGYLGMQGWQWLLLIEAAPAVILAQFVIVFLKNSPAEAPWLAEDEKNWLITQLAEERAHAEKKRTYSVIQCLTNPKVLFLAGIYFSNVCLLNSITFFMPRIVKDFGFSAQQTGWIVAIPSLLALFVMIAWGRHSDHKQERFGHAALANFLGGTALLCSVLIVDPTIRIALIAVAFACTLSFTSPFWAIPGSFLTGAAAAGGIGIISALGVSGGFLAPWYMGVMKEHTGDFLIGMGSIAILAMIFSVILYGYGVAEKKRELVAAQ